MKIFRIILGWWLFLFPSKQTKAIKEMARKRKSVCMYCSSNKFNVCIECGCPLEAKILVVDEECPKNKWPEWWRP